MYRLENTSSDDFPLKVKAGSVLLEGSLCIPPGVKGIVLFAQVNRLRSPQNKHAARDIQNSDMATLLVNLLTPEEEKADEHTARLRFDIKLLSRRLIEITDWLPKYLGAENVKMGYFGAGTGSAAALVAAPERPELIRAIVSRGGRPDLAGPALSRVKAPTLLIVGGKDVVSVEMNREALKQINSEKSMIIIPGASQSFEELGTMEEVARLAEDWFSRHFASGVDGGLK